MGNWRQHSRELKKQAVTKVFRRAGCGKSARPVRRGDGAPRILIRYASSYSTGPNSFFQHRLKPLPPGRMTTLRSSREIAVRLKQELKKAYAFTSPPKFQL